MFHPSTQLLFTQTTFRQLPTHNCCCNSGRFVVSAAVFEICLANVIAADLIKKRPPATRSVFCLRSHQTRNARAIEQNSVVYASARAADAKSRKVVNHPPDSPPFRRLMWSGLGVVRFKGPKPHSQMRARIVLASTKVPVNVSAERAHQESAPEASHYDRVSKSRRGTCGDINFQRSDEFFIKTAPAQRAPGKKTKWDLDGALRTLFESNLHKTVNFAEAVLTSFLLTLRSLVTVFN
jgi:hypothetical protein